MTLRFKHPVESVVARTFGSVFAPPIPILPSAWAAANLQVPDGPRAGEPWNLDLTPFIKEPLDMLGPDSPVNEIAAMKSAQTGFTTLLIAAIGHSIDRDPCRMMVIQPTDAALSDFNRDKLQPAIESSKALKQKVAPQTSRSSEGSTTYSKKFPKGSLTLAIATSAADLRSKTVKKLFRDEIDQYPDDLDGQGDPIEISDGRLMSFLQTGDWKKADISTPTIKGGSKIEARYEAGDRRRWHVPCPHCRKPDGTPSEFVFENGPGFRFDESFPHRAHYITPCCGTIVEAHEKISLVRRGRWVATAPRPGAYPSFHFDTFSSPFVPWDEIAKAILAAGDNPQKLKTLWNLWFGLPYEIKGDAPDHARLMERREEGLTRGHIPARGLILVGAADVQMRGIWVEITAFGSDRQSWTVDAFYIDGGTEDPAEGAFAKLGALTVDRAFPDAFGAMRGLDAFAVDSGYRSHVVYSWVRKHQRIHPLTGRDVVLAVDGRDGWGRPPIGTPSLVDINLAGQKVRKGCQLWPIGTWPIKGAFYSDLRKEGIRSGAAGDPPGYCHFGDWLDENFFRQLTSEYLADDVFRGKVRKIWKLKASERDNHFLDCRVYAIALAEYLGLSSLTQDQWANLAAVRGLPDEAWRPTIFTRPEMTQAPVSLAPPQTPPPQIDDFDPPEFESAYDKFLAMLSGINSGED